MALTWDLIALIVRVVLVLVAIIVLVYHYISMPRLETEKRRR